MHENNLLELLREIPVWVVEESDLYKPVAENLSGIDRRETIIIAFGKASPPMARAAVDSLGDSVVGGVVVFPRWMNPELPEGLESIPSSHPVPDEASVKAGEAVIEWAKSSRAARVVVLVSGGGSALVEYPREGLTIDDISAATRALLSSGASIHEINAVRKHLSLVKGGWLARHVYPKTLLGLYASDVPGDRLDSIASGPTVPDPSTFEDAIRIIRFYGLEDDMPENVMRILSEGARGYIEETPKPGDPVFDKVENRLVAANIDVLRGLADRLGRIGYDTIILTSRLEGESREAAKVLGSIALEALERGVPSKPPLAILAGGETTVTVRGPGKGGRNQELVLTFAITLDYWTEPDAPIGILAMDTDGIDGNTDAAGAYAVAGDSRRAREKGLDPLDYLASNNSYEILNSLNRLIKTGPVESNLNSIVVILIGKPDSQVQS